MTTAGEMASILEHLLAEEAEKLSKLIRDSHLEVASRFVQSTSQVRQPQPAPLELMLDDKQRLHSLTETFTSLTSKFDSLPKSASGLDCFEESLLSDNDVSRENEKLRTSADSLTPSAAPTEKVDMEVLITAVPPKRCDDSVIEEESETKALVAAVQPKRCDDSVTEWVETKAVVASVKKERRMILIDEVEKEELIHSASEQSHDDVHLLIHDDMPQSTPDEDPASRDDSRSQLSATEDTGTKHVNIVLPRCVDEIARASLVSDGEVPHSDEAEAVKGGANDNKDRYSVSKSPSETIRDRGKKKKEKSVGKRVLNSPMFETAFAGLIFFNALCMGLEQQYQGFDTGYDLQLGGYSTAKETWPYAETFILVAESFFGIVFTVEVGAKVVIFRGDFCKSLWNLYDTLIITCWLVQNLSVFSIFMPPLVLRLARMGRLLRLLRFAKAFQVFDVLHLLVRSMMACMTVLLWSMMFLLIVMMGTAILLVYLLQEECQNEAIPLEGRLALYSYFGNFTNGMFAMYELTMGNWVPISRTVIENVSEGYMMFFFFYRTLVGFAVLKVITAIFNAETFRVTQQDDGILLMHKERQIGMHTKRMHQLLLEGDDSQDGFLSLEEFGDLMRDKSVQRWLAAQEIELKDVQLAFNIIDDSGDGRVSAEELVRGLARLKGTAKSVDVVTIIHALHRVDVLLDRMDETLREMRWGDRVPSDRDVDIAQVLQNNVSKTFLDRL
eukprot:TRINITY_DN12849_c0_g1_i1.p1 TRINITY_DN12849_c0_g1~~TRINITY_DN12849_c0_g1_i1.p1  ORF type:complete len:727 (-),score=108.25 TRINITY_DN12849_c0_g1_i1:55-2235(-)